MIEAKHIQLRPMQREDWPLITHWISSRDAFFGAYQRYQLDILSTWRMAYNDSRLLTRETSYFMMEEKPDLDPIGFIYYTHIPFPDGDNPYPEVGFSITEVTARGKGYAREALDLLVTYIFNALPTERIAAFTDIENQPAIHTLEACGFEREGVIRRSVFRDGDWHDVAMYAILRASDD